MIWNYAQSHPWVMNALFIGFIVMLVWEVKDALWAYKENNRKKFTTSSFAVVIAAIGIFFILNEGI